MKILYGVVGEGMGHATRSRVVLSHLAKKHELLIVASGRAHSFLKGIFPDVVEIDGLELTYEKGAVDRSATFWDTVKSLPSMVSHNVKRFLEISKDFTPKAVVSDFESFAYLFGVAHDIPVISIDNMQVLNRCNLELEVPEKFKSDFHLAQAIVRGKLPGCHHYMITSFFFPEISKERTTLYAPILRDEILSSTVSHGEHILVYQTSTSNDALLTQLRTLKHTFVVYGFRREESIVNVQLRDFSQEGFVNDLASCRAVLATGGFSLMSECVYLGKPYLAVPVRKQFEQVLNSLYLQKLGYGEYHEFLSPEAIEGFLGKVDAYRRNLLRHTQDGNKKLLGDLDRLLESIADNNG